MQDILREIYLITPNTDELKTLFGNHPDVESLQALARSQNLNILWKGGHNDGALASDRLVTPDKVYTFSVTPGKARETRDRDAFSPRPSPRISRSATPSPTLVGWGSTTWQDLSAPTTRTWGCITAWKVPPRKLTCTGFLCNTSPTTRREFLFPNRWRPCAREDVDGCNYG